MPRYGQRSLYLSRCWLSEWCHTCIEAREVPDEGVLSLWQRSQPHRCFSTGLVKPLPGKRKQKIYIVQRDWLNHFPVRCRFRRHTIVLESGLAIEVGQARDTEWCGIFPVIPCDERQRIPSANISGHDVCCSSFSTLATQGSDDRIGAFWRLTSASGVLTRRGTSSGDDPEHNSFKTPMRGQCHTGQVWMIAEMLRSASGAGLSTPWPTNDRGARFGASPFTRT